MKLLVIGKNSTLGKIYKKKTKIKKIKFISHKDLNKISLKSFDHIVNFAINPKFKYQKYERSLDIDNRIIEKISNNAYFVMISSRFVYFHDNNFPFDEKKKCLPMNFYGKNKLTIEKNLKKKKRNLLILRLGTLLNFDLSKKHLFTSYLLNNLKEKKKVIIDLKKDVFKDFFTDDYFVKNLDFLIKKKIKGTYNLSSGIPINPKLIASKIMKGYGEGKLIFNYKNKLDKSFLLKNNKLTKITKFKLDKKKILTYSYNLGKKLRNA